MIPNLWNTGDINTSVMLDVEYVVHTEIAFLSYRNHDSRETRLFQDNHFLYKLDVIIHHEREEGRLTWNIKHLRPTLPKTNIVPENRLGPKRKFIFQPLIFMFRGYVSFREGIYDCFAQVDQVGSRIYFCWVLPFLDAKKHSLEVKKARPWK